jgi:hypothetical protein
MTATNQSIGQDNKERQKQAFEYQIESFLNSWAPADRYERSQFESQLHSLVRQIYADAQEPVFNELHRIIALLPFAPMTKKEPSDAS